MAFEAAAPFAFTQAAPQGHWLLKWLEWDWPAIVSAVGTIGAALVAWWAYQLAARQLPLAVTQITGMKKSLDIAGSANELEALARIVEVEKDVSVARLRVELAEAKLERAASFAADSPAGDDAESIQITEEVEALADDFPILVDAYFRSLDRLAFCILSGLLAGKDWKEQYQYRFQLDLSYFRESLGEHPLDTFPHLEAVLRSWGADPGEWGEVPTGNDPEKPPI